MPGESSQSRRTIAATTMALFAGLYTGLSIFYFYEDFFQFTGNGIHYYLADRSGLAVHIQGFLWTVLSPWRLAIAALTIILLSGSSIALHRRSSLGRPLALFTLWGVMLPQVFWFTELSVDWYGGAGLATIMVIGPLLALIPTALLYEGPRTLMSWSPKLQAPSRILGSAIALAWVGFFATECLDHSYQMTGNTPFVAANICIALAALGAYGFLRLRTWALPVALGACAAFAIIPMSFDSTRYMGSGGYIDATVRNTMGSCSAVMFTALLPILAVSIIAGPYMVQFIRKLIKD